MALSRLVATAQPVALQETSLSLDALGRFVCSTWDEATSNGGPPFTAVVIGSGMYGGYCAAKLYRERPAARILVLEAGPFLVGEHVQNLGRVGRVGLGVPAAISPTSDPGVARELVWGIPWRGNVEFPGLAYCCGGKSLYWGGWCPRLTDADLAQWPAATAAYLRNNYTFVENETGVVPAADFITGDLHQVLMNRVRGVAGSMPGIDTTGGDGVEIAPLAVQGSPPESGLFGFDKFSSVPLLTDAIREDVESSALVDARRRLFLVPRAHVVRLAVDNGVVRSIEVDVAGERHALPVQTACMVVLAASTVESTRLALQSTPSPLMGRNLMAHVRSDFTVRIRRTAFPPLPVNVQTGALLVRGAVPTGRFHLQVTSSTSRGGSDELLFRLVPDLDLLDAQRANSDPNWVSITLRGIGEMRGDRTTPLHDPAKSWLDLSPFEVDEFGVPRAWVHLALSPEDQATWSAMDHAAVALAQLVAGSPAAIEYLYDGRWTTTPFPLDRPFPEWHRGLGTTYHEAGTLWMGDQPANSVTDPTGRLHHVANLWVCDQSVFPTVGSVNPALTGMTVAKLVAEQHP